MNHEGVEAESLDCTLAISATATETAAAAGGGGGRGEEEEGVGYFDSREGLVGGCC